MGCGCAGGKRGTKTVYAWTKPDGTTLEFDTLAKAQTAQRQAGRVGTIRQVNKPATAAK